MRFLILGRSVRKEKKAKKIGEERSPVTLQSLEMTRRGTYKVNMVTMEDGKIDVLVKLQHEQQKKMKHHNINCILICQHCQHKSLSLLIQLLKLCAIAFFIAYFLKMQKSGLARRRKTEKKGDGLTE